MYSLTPEQIDSFNEKGYLIIPYEEHGLFDRDALQRWTKEVEQWPREKGKWMPYDEINSQGERQLMRVECFADYHDEYNSFMRGEDLIDILGQLSGKKMYLFKDKINFKYQNGGGFGAHTDAPAYTHVGDITHLTCNVAIDAATPENGCLEVVEGSHKMEVPLGDDRGVAKDWEQSHQWTPVPLEVGDLLFFGSYLAHRSGPNSTPNSRRALYATYHSSDEGDALRKTYYDHRRVAFPPDHERVPGVDYSEGIRTYAFAAPFAVPTSS